MKLLRNKRGITLIALVITIIVLLLLAGISISMIAGNNSVLNRAGSSRVANAFAAAKDEVNMKIGAATQDYFLSVYNENTEIGTYSKSELDTRAMAAVTSIETADVSIKKTWNSNKQIVLKYNPDGSTIKGTLDNGVMTWGEIEYEGQSEPKPITSISEISPANPEVEEGETITIAVTINEDATEDLIWKSSDESIAVVEVSEDNNGTSVAVKGISVGETTLTVKNESSTQIQNCTLTVKKRLPLWNGTKRNVILSTTENTRLEDNKGNVIWIPANFMISKDNADNGEAGNNVEEGVIIEDNSGNQFVWVPVGTITRSDNTTTTITLGRYTFNSTTGAPSGPYTGEKAIGECYEKASVDKKTIARTMEVEQNGTTVKKIASVEKTNEYGGYYIGRFEAGQGENNIVVCKKGATVYHKINRSTALSLAQGMYGIVTKINQDETETPLYASDLVTSYAWDTAVVFIEKCGLNSNYANQNRIQTSLKTTGNAQDSNGNNDVQCNIYDMAGNVCEWSTEYAHKASDSAVIRGGFYNYNGISVGSRRTHYPSSSNYYDNGVGGIGFRPILYIM